MHCDRHFVYVCADEWRDRMTCWWYCVFSVVRRLFVSVCLSVCLSLSVHSDRHTLLSTTVTDRQTDGQTNRRTLWTRDDGILYTAIAYIGLCCKTGFKFFLFHMDLAPPLGWLHWNLPKPRKRDCLQWTIMRCYLSAWWYFSRFDRSPTCDCHTDTAITYSALEYSVSRQKLFYWVITNFIEFQRISNKSIK